MATRDWRRVHKDLVKRGEILLDLRILDRWDSELERMNAGKEGGQYAYPKIFVRLLGYMRVLFHLPYGQTEGFLQALRRFDALKRGYLKIHIAVDVKRKKTLALKVTDERISDGQMSSHWLKKPPG